MDYDELLLTAHSLSVRTRNNDISAVLYLWNAGVRCNHYVILGQTYHTFFDDCRSLDMLQVGYKLGMVVHWRNICYWSRDFTRELCTQFLDYVLSREGDQKIILTHDIYDPFYHDFAEVLSRLIPLCAKEQVYPLDEQWVDLVHRIPLLESYGIICDVRKHEYNDLFVKRYLYNFRDQMDRIDHLLAGTPNLVSTFNSYSYSNSYFYGCIMTKNYDLLDRLLALGATLTIYDFIKACDEDVDLVRRMILYVPDNNWFVQGMYKAIRNEKLEIIKLLYDYVNPQKVQFYISDLDCEWDHSTTFSLLIFAIMESQYQNVQDCIDVGYNGKYAPILTLLELGCSLYQPDDDENVPEDFLKQYLAAYPNSIQQYYNKYN